MYFYEVIEQCDTDAAVRFFLELCTNSPDIQHTEQCIRHTIAELKRMQAVKSDSEIIEIERVSAGNEAYDAVRMHDLADHTQYGLEANPWKATLGYTVDEKSLSEYGKERFAALVLWEMTWFGFDDETVQNHVKSWDTE